MHDIFPELCMIVPLEPCMIQLIDHTWCNSLTMHDATHLPYMMQLIDHALCNSLTIHEATHWPCMMQLIDHTCNSLTMDDKSFCTKYWGALIMHASALESYTMVVPEQCMTDALEPCMMVAPKPCNQPVWTDCSGYFCPFWSLSYAK
jgi:hypothetical protein